MVLRTDGRPGPLGRGIGWRNELRDNLAGGAPRCIVEGRQILLHRAAGPRRITIFAPILTCDRALLVGIRLDQAGIDRKTFAANQTGGDARLDDSLEHVAENISIAETLVTGARKCRMIGRSAAPSGSQTRTPRPASGSSVPDRSTGDPSTNSEVQVRCEARTDREQHRSSAPDDPRAPRRQDETRRTVDLGHSSDGPSWIDLVEIRVNTTESRFAACLNRLLQQNRHDRDMTSGSPKPASTAPAKLAHSAGAAVGHLRSANVAVA